MNNTLSKITIFTVGAAIGSAVTWTIMKDRYERLVREDRDSIREYYERKYSADKEEVLEEEPEPDDAQVAIEDYAAELNKNGYTNYSSVETKKEEDTVEKPYVITPDEFGELYDYQTNSLIYFADGVLTDDNYELIEDVDDIVGCDSLNHFGEYEEDSVFVRNDRLEADYEILLDPRKYVDAVNKSPHQSEVE